ncbi:MAG: adenosylcobinamide-GDP ribazoletransferase [Nitrospinae bacterium CG11_big_fil_rev_8_21_14_0_20_45_15]|nr:MAG: adenosylcobinamide-GDP ribazoletransferase [Nitrospinae bacterium CG11_big_fil_rev_8_21_14_0_20_45_15]
MNFLSALGFLTLIPVPIRSFSKDGSQIAWFPFVGLLIGGMLFAIDALGAAYLTPSLRAVFDIVFLTLISGGLHLDGLADSADGMFSHRDREQTLLIMKDPRIGVMGVLTLCLCFLLKYAGLLAICGEHGMGWLILAPALGRTMLTTGLVVMRHPQSDAALSNWLYQKGKYQYLAGGVIPFTLAFYIGLAEGLAVLFLFFITGYCILRWFENKIGGVTGDGLGALGEIIETLTLVLGGVFCACS